MSFLHLDRSSLRLLLLGGLSATLFVSFLSGLIPAVLLTFLAPFPLYLGGLRAGPKPLAVATIAAGVLCLMLAGIEVVALYLTLVGVPVFLLVLTAWRHGARGAGASSPGGLSEQSGLFAPEDTGRVTALALMHQFYTQLLLLGLFVLFWKGIDGATLKPLLKGGLKAYGLDFQDKAVDLYYSMLPGFCAAGTGIILFLNGLGAQQILRVQGRLSLPVPKLEALTLPFWPWMVLAGAGITAFAFPQSILGEYGRNVLLVLRVLFLLQGLSVAHAYARTKAQGKVFLILLYFFTFVIEWVGLIIAGLGVLEPWIKVRQRLANRQ